VITTYEQVRIFQDELLGVNWGYAVLDEGHKIRNPDAIVTLACKQVRSRSPSILPSALPLPA